MKFTIISGRCDNFLLAIAILLCRLVKGDILRPPVEAIPENSEWVSVNADGFRFTVQEEWLISDNPTNLVKIRYTGDSSAITIDTNNPSIVLSKEGSDVFIRINSKLDYESAQSHLINIFQGGPPTSIYLDVEDINDNQPQLVPPSCSSAILKEDVEMNEPAALVCTYNATDPDGIDRDELRFEFTEPLGDGNKDSYELNQISGEFRLVRAIDYAQSPNHRFVVYVYDSDELHFDSLIFNIAITDVPNLYPIWSSIMPLVTVKETDPVGKEIQTIVARDGDSQVRCEIKYSIIFDNLQMARFFDLNIDSGLLTVKEPISATEINQLNGGLVIGTRVFATENNNRTAWSNTAKYPDLEINTTLQITIEDTNSHPPEICFGNMDDEDCTAPDDLTIDTQENSVGALTVKSGTVEGSINIRDLDPTQVFNTYNVRLEADEQYIVDALIISPPSGNGRTTFTISTRSSISLDYEEEISGSSDGKWWRLQDGVPVPKPVKFSIVATDNNDPLKEVEKEITLIVRDENDESPVHVPNYTFAVCEDVAEGTILKEITYDPNNPVCEMETSEVLHLEATDDDISPEFGTESIQFLWTGTKKPPLDLNKDSGEMTVSFAIGSQFDYERYKEEEFTVDAEDEKGNPDSSGRRKSSANVKFVILDVNDTPPDLRVSKSRVEIEEESVPGTELDVTIMAEDADLAACIDFSLRIESTTNIPELDDRIKMWFRIEEEGDAGCKKATSARIRIVESPDREGYNLAEVDRVDVVIIANDTTTKPGLDNGVIEFRLTIDIIDTNDNAPEFQDFDENADIEFRENVGDDADESASPSQREITSFRATDQDRSTQFEFFISSGHEGMTDLVDLEFTPNGRAVLRRRSTAIIDREFTGFYEGQDTDYLLYTITVSDSVLNTSINIRVDIEDVNDNPPEFPDTLPKEFTVTEKEGKSVHIFLADDADRKERFGNVSYLLLPEDNPIGLNHFEIGLQDGDLTVNVDTAWHIISEYRLKITAIDYYRPTSSSLSLRTPVDITVTVIDTNDHAPDFERADNDLLIEVKETDLGPGIRFDSPFVVLDLDDHSLGNGEFGIIITTVECTNAKVLDPKSFFAEVQLENISTAPSQKNVWVVAAKSFENNWGMYTIHFEAEDRPTSGNTQKSNAFYRIDVKSENLHEPVFEYPNANSRKLYIQSVHPINAPLEEYNGDAVPLIVATDEDDPSIGNGQVSVSLEKSSAEVQEIFTLVPRLNGYSLQLKVPFPQNDSLYTVILRAFDHGEEPLETDAVLEIQVYPGSNSLPIFKDVPNPFLVDIMENTMPIVQIPKAYDLDLEIGFPDVIYYHLVGSESAKNYFEVHNPVDEANATLRPITMLDREELDFHQVIIFVSNSATEPTGPIDLTDPSYLAVNVAVLDEKDVPPEFVVKGVISGGISDYRHQKGSLAMTIRATDADLNDPITYTIDSSVTVSDATLENFLPNPFILRTEDGFEGDSNKIGNLTIDFSPTTSMKGFFSFRVKAKNDGDMSATTDVKIYVIQNSNVVSFIFSNTLEEITEKREKLVDILSEVFGYRCNIDNMVQEQGGQLSDQIVTVQTHFIDLILDVPIPASVINSMQFDTNTLRNLINKLRDEQIYYESVGNSNENADEESNLVTYFLIAGIAILGVILAISAVMWFFNNRSLTRRVRALNATAFGSQQSGLNRAGATTLELPNTNRHAIEGSNPIWTTKGEKKVPDFDTESIGSGGSVLIGAEDEDYFKNYKGTDGGIGMSNPLFNMNVDDSGHDFGSGAYSDSSLGDDNNPPYNPDMPETNDNDNYLDIPMPPVTRRNPLMNMDMHMDDSDS